MRVYAKHEPYWSTGHLGHVVEEMRRLGPPSINVVNYKGQYMALEGSHRLAAAMYLGLTPKFIVHEVDLDDYGQDWWNTVISRLPHYWFPEGERNEVVGTVC